jgi:hypothetical protein
MHGNQIIMDMAKIEQLQRHHLFGPGLIIWAHALSEKMLGIWGARDLGRRSYHGVQKCNQPCTLVLPLLIAICLLPR